jgi:hypothetical protein
MTSPTLARSERHALCDLLTEVGADAPTLCEGWNAFDLAAHLVVRERRPDGVTHEARAGTPKLTITGPPGEIALFSSGRRVHARVEVEGDPAALEALAAARLGV